MLLERAAEVGATVVREGMEFGVAARTPAVGGQVISLQGLRARYDDVFLPLYGAHQAQNAAVALAAVEAFGTGALDDDLVRAAFAEVTSPGRLEIIRRSPTIVLDAAHNPHGAEALAAALEDSFSFSPLVGVMGVMEDKDHEGVLAAFEPHLAYLVCTQNSTPRSMSAAALGRAAGRGLRRGPGQRRPRPGRRDRPGRHPRRGRGGDRRLDRRRRRARHRLRRHGRRGARDAQGPPMSEATAGRTSRGAHQHRALAAPRHVRRRAVPRGDHPRPDHAGDDHDRRRRRPAPRCRVGLGLAVVCLLLAGMLRAEWAYLAGYAVQVAAIAPRLRRAGDVRPRARSSPRSGPAPTCSAARSSASAPRRGPPGGPSRPSRSECAHGWLGCCP